MNNAAGLLCARPCAKALCCPGKHWARHPDAVLGVRPLRAQKRAVISKKLLSKVVGLWLRTSHPRADRDPMLQGVMGSQSSWGQGEIYTRKGQDGKLLFQLQGKSEVRRGLGAWGRSTAKTQHFLRSQASLPRWWHLCPAPSLPSQAFQNMRVKSTRDRWSAANQKYVSPPLVQTPR